MFYLALMISTWQEAHGNGAIVVELQATGNT